MKGQEKQNYVLSKFEKDSILNRDLYNNLELENDDLLIIFDDTKSVILKKDKIFIKTRCGNGVIFSKELTNVHHQRIKEMINHLLEINPAHLNYQENQAGDRLLIQDSKNYKLNLFKNNKIVTLESYALDYYIELKVLFYKEREILLDAFDYITPLFYDEEYKRIQSLDTLYIKVDSDNNIKRVVKSVESKNLRIEDIFIYFKCATMQLTNYNNKSFKKSTNTFYTNRNFLKNNSSKIQDYDVLNKYTMCDMEELLKTKKTIYLIDIKKKKGNKFQTMEVKGGTYCFGYP